MAVEPQSGAGKRSERAPESVVPGVRNSRRAVAAPKGAVCDYGRGPVAGDYVERGCVDRGWGDVIGRRRCSGPWTPCTLEIEAAQ
jgi:hypothetical protein